MNDSKEIKERLYLTRTYTSAKAQAGGVIYRNKADVLQNVTYEELRDSVYDRSFHLIETASIYIIVCNTDPIQIHC